MGGVSPSTSSCCFCQDPPEFSPGPTMLHLKILRQMSSKTLFILFPHDFNIGMLRLQPCVAHLCLSPEDLNWEMSGTAQRGVPGAGGLNASRNRRTSPRAAPALPPRPQRPQQLAHLPSTSRPLRRQVPDTMLGRKLCTESFFSLAVGSVII